MRRVKVCTIRRNIIQGGKKTGAEFVLAARNLESYSQTLLENIKSRTMNGNLKRKRVPQRKQIS